MVTSSLPAETVKAIVEQTGKTAGRSNPLQISTIVDLKIAPLAVLVGAGSLGAAVAMVGWDGDYYNKGAKGVIRLTQVRIQISSGGGGILSTLSLACLVTSGCLNTRALDLQITISGGQRTMFD